MGSYPQGFSAFLPNTLLTSLFLAFALFAVPAKAEAASYRTRNFIVRASNSAIAAEVGRAAEAYRESLAIDWLGKELPTWAAPCQVRVQIEDATANGETTYVINRGEVFGWRMVLRGQIERIIESVLPHEINHTIFASHFRRSLPRWADEGAAALCEGEQDAVRRQFRVAQLTRTRRIPLRSLLSLADYPDDSHSMLLVYAQGYLLTQFLVQQEDKAAFIRLLKRAANSGWEAALKEVYGYRDLDALDVEWQNWMKLRRGEERPQQVRTLADNSR